MKITMLLIGFVGFYCLTSFAQSMRLGYINKIATVAGALLIPSAISLFIGLALAASWWAILIFLIASLAGGIRSGFLMRQHGQGQIALLIAQPTRAIVFLSMALAIWVPKIFFN